MIVQLSTELLQIYSSYYSLLQDITAYYILSETVNRYLNANQPPAVVFR
jgi:hypothetical protein